MPEIMGKITASLDTRSSKLGDIQPDHWLAEYTTELLNVLHVLALLVELKPVQAKLLEAICEGPTLNYRR